MPNKYRIFRGKETRKVGVNGLKQDDAWYWEPMGYEGNAIWSGPFRTYQEAEEEAEEMIGWDGSF